MQWRTDRRGFLQIAGAGLASAIADLGHGVADRGDLAPEDVGVVSCPNPAVHSLREVLGWTEVLADKVDDALSQGGMPIILGGDHSLALGSVAGAARPLVAEISVAVGPQRATARPARFPCFTPCPHGAHPRRLRQCHPGLALHRWCAVPGLRPAIRAWNGRSSRSGASDRWHLQ